MRSRIALLAVFAAFLVWAVGVGAAQQPTPQNQNVQITQGPRVESVTASSAVIAWSTNVNASTMLKYGTDRNHLDQTAEAPWGGLTHRVTIHNLKPNTTYYFDVESAQGQGTGTGAISGVSEFKTQNGPSGVSYQQPAAAPSRHVPVVGGPIPQKVTDTSMHLWWETSEPAPGETLRYGLSENALNQTAPVSDTNNGVTHGADISNLQPNTTYWFKVFNPDGTPTKTTTARTMPPNYAKDRTVDITDGPVVEYISDHEIHIAWQTSAPSSSIVRYGTSNTALNQTAQAPWGSGTHRVVISNLQPNTKYWFRVESGQAQGTGTVASTGTFPIETLPAGQAAMNVPFQKQ